MKPHITITPNQIRNYAQYTISDPPALSGFPLCSIDTDSYIVGADIQSGIDLDVAGGRHCLAIGKGCSLADDITFMIDLNHDYGAVAQGELSFLRGTAHTRKSGRKASIIIQNDVWIGHGVLIMAGVVLHNGCVAAANSVITKDVPPYAIVGGNPAKVIRYRFDGQTINALQQIAWWDWPPEVLSARSADFDLPAEVFAEKYAPKGGACSPTPEHPVPHPPVVLFIPDLDEPYPLYPKVFAQYFEKDRPQTELLIYVPGQDPGCKKQKLIEDILHQYLDRDTGVTIQTGSTLDEHMLFRNADYYVTTRARHTVPHTCLADLYNVKILFGTDEPVFPPDLV